MNSIKTSNSDSKTVNTDTVGNSGSDDSSIDSLHGNLPGSVKNTDLVDNITGSDTTGSKLDSSINK